MQISFNDLIGYTEWERRKWRQCFEKNGEYLLTISVGPHRDERFESVGDWVKHIFSAEIRYVERLSGQPLTDASLVPSHNLNQLFQFGERTRKALEEFVATFPAAEWDVPRGFTVLKYQLRMTPRKTITHALLHEIRHWAQIATMLRLNGYRDESHDFLVSPVMGGEIKQQSAQP
jgi:uncharacterized damage-inducible protein DinB